MNRAWQQAEARRLASEQAALTAIKPDELALSAVRYNEVRAYDGQTLLGWTLDGTVTNNSPDRVLESLKFEVTVRDSTERSARIIGQEIVGLCKGVFEEDHLAAPPAKRALFTPASWSSKICRLRERRSGHTASSRSGREAQWRGPCPPDPVP